MKIYTTKTYYNRIIKINKATGCWIASKKAVKSNVRTVLMGKKFELVGIKCLLNSKCVHPLHNSETKKRPFVSGV